MNNDKKNRSLKEGVTVLICTYNGEKNLSSTLTHLASQRVDLNIEWEILLVDNACTDNSAKVALKIWKEFRLQIPLTILTQHKRGKDNAIDLGFEKAKYSFIIICDDDNWLDGNYIQLAYTIMKANPDIGMLGGKGIPVFAQGCEQPTWFNRFQKYYAVGPQSFLNGEINHYWPIYRFIWGAGAVVNLEAYHYLKDNNFKRILAFDKYPSIARSEDVELSLAIWLAGYKLWYDDRLVFEHFISRDKLNFFYLMKILRQSISAIHYLRPYHILIFTGPQNAPTKSFWRQYIVYYLRLLWTHFGSQKYFKMLTRIMLNKHSEDELYVDKAIVWYQFKSVFSLGRGYDKHFKSVSLLQKTLPTAHKINAT